MEATGLRLGFCSVPERESAEAIAHALVDERLAACVNIIPQIKSIYRWEGRVESNDEVLLIIKTSTQVPMEKLRDRILTLHPYDVPELVMVPVTDGLDKYLAWVEASVSTVESTG